MYFLVGNARLTTVGNISPTATALRVYSVDAHSTISASSLTLHNGVVSSTTATIYKVLSTDAAGNIHQDWTEGLYFPGGVWLDTYAAGTVTTVISYRTVNE